MYKKLLSISVAIFLLGKANGQQQIKVPHRSLLEATNGQELQAIYEQNIKAELTYAKDVLGLNIEPQTLLDGTVMQLVGVSENGIPKYIKTDNAGAAKTIGTNKVHPGGSLGLSLSGIGMTNRLGIWDGGAVRVGHQEFQGRAVQTDGTTTLSDHATHVAGTMIGGGVQVNAKGMSFQAPLKCYFWDNDVNEMNTAAGSGMLVSNHSYGAICGWYYDDANTQWKWYGDVNLSSTEDNKFGLYNDDAQAWDQTVYNNPFYLPFKSAGNDRGDVPSTAATRVYFNSNTNNWVPFSGATPPADGQYDCISTNGVAKNILTIGAVNKITNGWNGASSVVMSSFSGWGPTDDGRIKPDICAAGVDLYSSYSGNNTAYSSISGTSMASPNASGSALLIQQHYNNLKGKFMRASSLKGLIIHTADEAGSNPGPDYSFGWGLMNTAKAVQSISDSGENQIIEAQIPTDLTPFVKTVVSNGTIPLKITLCWTDIAAAASSNVIDDQITKLINDLDVRVVRVSDNQQFLPYILNPATPNAAATNGDNFRDNVEQIFIATPSAGAYAIKVSSKRGFPNNLSQSFSLMIGGISPKPAANFSASAQMSCVGSQITFTNNSSSSNTAVWYFPGGSPSTSTLANPIVTYSAAGNYPVALKVTGVSGEDSLYKLDYIKIGGLTLPLIETFESNSQTANLWRAGNIYNDTFSFRKWTNALGTTPGNTVVGVNLYDNPITTRRYQLFSPILDLRGMQNANLSFQHAYSRYDGSSKDSLIVSISSNCGSTWNRLLGMTENRPSNGSKMATFTGVGDPAQTSQYAFVPSLAADWCSTNINSTPCNSIGLNSFVGLNNLIIRFEVYYGGGNNLFLDNINITGTPFSPKAGFKVPSLVCANQNTVLTDTSLNNPSLWNWVVSGPQNFTSTSKNPSFNFSSTGMYSVKLKVSNVSGSDSVTVTNSFEVKASPAKPLVSQLGSLLLCNNDSTLLTSTASNLQWYRDSVAIVGEINSNYYNKNAGKIAVRTMGSNGCSAQSDLYTFSTGTNPPIPTITKSLAGNQFCEGGSFTLTSSASSANTWMRNGVNMSGQTATSLNFNDSGTFNVKVSNGVCSSISVPLTISKLPRPNTSDITASKFAYKNDTASYWVNGLPTSGFTWVVSGGIIQSGQNTNNIVVKWSTGTNGVVQVTEKGTNGCNGAVKTYPVGIWNTAVSNVSNNNDFILFPNPTNQILNIKYLGSTINNLNITVFDVFGKKVLSQDINLNNNSQQVLDLAHLAKGVYIIKLVADNFSGSKIITKE